MQCPTLLNAITDLLYHFSWNYKCITLNTFELPLLSAILYLSQDPIPSATDKIQLLPMKRIQQL